MNYYENCPQCDSKRVTKMSKSLYFLIGLGSIGVCGLLGILFPPIWLGVLLGIGLMCISPFLPPMLQCQDCKKTWKYVKNKNTNVNIESPAK